MSFDFSTLITDRTNSDVTFLSDLLKKPILDWTEEDANNFNKGLLKGGYWWTDLNRVTACMDYINQELKKLGYSTGYMNISVHPESQPEYDENTLFLLQGDAIADKSIYNRPLNNNGVTLSENQHKLHNTSLFFDGGDWITFPSINLRTSDFTIDWWEYLTGPAGTRFYTFYQNVYLAGGILISFSDGDCYVGETPGEWDIFMGQKMIDHIIGEWVHRAIVRKGSSWKSYKNGKLFWEGDSEKSPFFDPSANISIGMYRSGYESYLYGYIDEFRISNIERWSSNFIPNNYPYTIIKNPAKEANIWYPDDVPNLYQMDRLLLNVSSLRSAIAEIAFNPLTPKTMKNLTHNSANTIEKILLNIGKMVENMKRNINLGWALGIADVGIYGGV